MNGIYIKENEKKSKRKSKKKKKSVESYSEDGEKLCEVALDDDSGLENICLIDIVDEKITAEVKSGF